MDRNKIAEALRAAMKAGAVEHPGYFGVDPKSDLAVVTRATSVGNPQTVTKLVESIAQDETFAALARKHMALGLGGLLSEVNLPNMTSAMLAQAIARRDVDGVVADFAHLFAANEAEVLVVMALIGVRVSRETQLGNKVRLVSLNAVPPSVARGQAMGQQTTLFAMRQTGLQATAALTIRTRVAPLFAEHKEFTSSLEKERRRYLAALSELDEARDCLTLVGSCAPVMHSTWTQYLGTAAFLGGGNMWSVGDPVFEMPEIALDVDEAERVCAAYFAWQRVDRERALRVPLDRLARAVRQRSPVDRAIDLGIALEALLLHDAEPGELTHRLSERGAWLGGRDVKSREALYQLLQLVYQLRSRAVHSGVLGDRIGKVDSAEVLRDGIAACGSLIRSAIDKGRIIENWRSLVLGG